jgi:hypothetical protein
MQSSGERNRPTMATEPDPVRERELHRTPIAGLVDKVLMREIDMVSPGINDPRRRAMVNLAARIACDLEYLLQGSVTRRLP